MKKLLTALSIVAITSSFACKSEEGTAATDAPAAAAPSTSVVELKAEGSELNPPVTPDRIPAGAWYCDMGTVHYARPDKGDGKCPLCHMDLKEKK